MSTVTSSIEEINFRHGMFLSFTRGDIFAKYDLGKKLGSGGFSQVRHARNKDTGAMRAVKTIRKALIREDPTTREMFINEICMLRRMDHPNILKIYDLIEERNYYHIVTELCTGGELFAYIVNSHGITETIAAHIMRQVLGVVAYCHRNNIIHRDLKPENLLLVRPNELNVKVIDFGTSHMMQQDDERLNLQTGTAYYIAPEVMRRNYTKACDVWSAGVILYILLCGYPPFNGNTDIEIKNKVSLGVFSFPDKEWKLVSSEAKDLITRMLEMDEYDRISAEDALNHPWFVAHEQVQSSEESVQLAFTSLQSFRAEKKLQHAFLKFFAEQLITQEDTQELNKIFVDLDRDKDGRLSRKELYEGYLQVYGNPEKASKQVDAIMEQVDITKSGYIDYSEFVIAAVDKKKLMSKKNLELAFKAFDNDANGNIGAEELKTMLCVQEDDDNQVIGDLIA